MHLLALLVLLAGHQGDTLGKTEAQILAMGEEKWDAFYGSKMGNSTAAMVEMNELFGQAALHRNQTLEKKASPSGRARVEKLRKYMGEYARHATELGYNVGGGGTMWASISADIPAQTELALYPILGGTAKRAAHVRATDMKKELDGISSTLSALNKDKSSNPNFGYLNAKGQLGGMRNCLAPILVECRALSRANSDRILGFCVEYGNMANGDWG